MDVFLSFRPPAAGTHGGRYSRCHGPYGGRDEALAVLRAFYGAAPVVLLPPDPAAPRRMTYEF